MLHRRQILFALSAIGFAGPATALALRVPVVTILGDSITAGLGLPAAQALPAQLQAALVGLKVTSIVRGAGVSGDTSADGLARVDFSVRSDTALCIVALGGNDLLQGREPKSLHSNLDQILKRLELRRIKALLAGLHPPPALGPAYAKEFSAVFSDLARKHRVALYPDLMAGVGPALRQEDGIHPTAKGAARIAAGLAPLVAQAVRAPVVRTR